ncbi:SAM-dependent methyltransferase [Terribacillus saccharophilus]|uniref:SAM-dependent methyltransferase n=1 Tax=Terribacillus saccharophilus TaxID=361277 RepID=A0A268HCJ9_9BACI|nr:class I SAM-dependent methyltransferase [Terribacillus saccharophilus]PAE07598.1 SAM-dependent methyltransferase [Terribacillus saccharophilus]
MNMWNMRFQNEQYVYGTEPNKFLADMQRKLNLSGTALAIAEGEGRNAAFLAEQGMRVTAWDYAESGLAKTEKLASSKGVTVQTKLVDLMEADWQAEKENWDEVVCVFGHFPTKLRHKTLQGVKEAIKPGGYFLTEVYSNHQIPYNSGGPKEADFLYKIEDFLDVFAGWDIKHLYMGEVIRHEGTQHTGLAHVIQFAGQKTGE